MGVMEVRVPTIPNGPSVMGYMVEYGYGSDTLVNDEGYTASSTGMS